MIKIFESDLIEAEFYMKDEEPSILEGVPHVKPSQVHGNKILVVNASNIAEYSFPNRPEADGILLTSRNSQASLRFADCAPVLIWDNDFVMHLHSGYKGTVLNICSEGIKLFPPERINSLRAWIGACIGRKFYGRNLENDEWTLKGLTEFHPENYDRKGDKVFFDLAGEIKSQLLECGLKNENIILSGIDTMTDFRCYSYRRGDKTERMTLLAKLK